MSSSTRLFQIGYRIATTERVWNFPVVYNRIAQKREGQAPEASNDASNESVTKLFASARIRLMFNYRVVIHYGRIIHFITSVIHRLQYLHRLLLVGIAIDELQAVSGGFARSRTLPLKAVCNSNIVI
jgi:hypothetical protein